jgi:hypothetical protein
MHTGRYVAVCLLILAATLISCRAAQYADEGAVVVRRAVSLSDEAAVAAKAAAAAGGSIDDVARMAAAGKARTIVNERSASLLQDLAPSAPQDEFTHIFSQLVCLYADHRDSADMASDIRRLLSGLSWTLSASDVDRITRQASLTSSEVSEEIRQLSATTSVGIAVGCQMAN